MMSKFSEGDFTANWDDAKKDRLEKEFERVLERFNRDDVPSEVKNIYTTLAAFMPEILSRGV